MTDVVPEIEGMSIVMLGSFNAPIFQPAWFQRHGLLSDGDASVEVQFINNEYCSFRNDWCVVEVLPDRFQITSQTAPAPEQLRDLVLGAFGVLSHTPISRVGINSHSHFLMPDEDRWNRFGHRLVPKPDFWEPVLPKAGTLNVTVIAPRSSGHAGSTQVVVEPSSQVRPGIYVAINDDFQAEESQTDSSAWARQVLAEEWEASRERAAGIRQHLMRQALEG